MDSRKRGVLRATVTRLAQKAQDLLKTEAEEKDIDSVLGALRLKQQQLQAADEELAANVDEKALQEEVEQTLEYDLLAGRTISSLTRRLQTLQDQRKSRAQAAETAASTPQQERANLATQPAIRLPKLQPPSFSGDRTQWTAFWDRFSSSIHDNPSLSVVDKFGYLQSCLSGEAKDSIAGLSITRENYKIATDNLQRRFGSRSGAVRDHLAKFSTLACSSASAQHLRNFYDQINGNVRSLENLGVSVTSYETMLLPNLLAKLPEVVRLGMLRTARMVAVRPSNSDSLPQMSDGNGLDSVEEFLNVLELEILVREEAALGAGAQVAGSNSSQKAPTGDRQSKEGTVSTLHTKATKVARASSACPFCDGEHAPEKCNKLVDVPARLQSLKDQRRCFSCLTKGHSIKTCYRKKQCDFCKLKHHPSLCSAQAEQSQRPADKMPSGSIDKVNEGQKKLEKSAAHKVKNQEVKTMAMVTKAQTVILPTAGAVLMSPDGGSETRVRILFDSASNRSFILSSVAERMGLRAIGKETMEVTTFGGTEPRVLQTEEVEFQLRKLDSDTQFTVRANTVPYICSHQPVVSSVHNEHFQHLDLADWDISSESVPEINILIGADQFYDLVTGQVVRPDTGTGLVAVASQLGWLLCGSLSDGVAGRDTKQEQVLLCCAQESEKSLDSCHMEKFWTLEGLGITSTSEPDQPPFELNTRFENGRYSVQLPWKVPKNELTLPDNFDVAFRRLQSNLNKLRREPELLQEYHRILINQKEAGIVEEASDSTRHLIHYLPHQAVIRPEAESTKVTVVFDASAKQNRWSPTLNECLETGSSSLIEIPRLLQAFRLHPIALTADIEKAFLQIRIAEDDRDALRFLWPQDPSRADSPLVVLRYAALVFGLTCSPAILEAVIQHHLASNKEQHTQFVDKVSKEIYVDNLISGCASEQQAMELIQKSRDIFNRAGMNLRHWQSNSAAVLSKVFASTNDQDVLAPALSAATGSVREDPSSYSSVSLGQDGVLSKVLGLKWETNADKFVLQFSPPEELIRAPQTKRVMLQLLARVYDPLGLLVPLLTGPKSMFQSLCVHKVAWDGPLDEPTRQLWLKWLQDMQRAKFYVPRLVISTMQTVEEMQLHGFCDASAKCYAACLYLRVQYTDGSVSCNLVAAKARVAPLSALSIPRLELLGALILARLLTSALNQHSQVRQVFCWTDSADTLYWIRQHKPWKLFVHNRVAEIRRLLPEESWRHVPGEENPADVASRGTSVDKLKSDTCWWHGPDWLTRPTEDWPDQSFLCLPLAPTDEEQKSPASKSVVLTTETAPEFGLQQVLQDSNFSSWTKLIRVTAYVLRFVRNLKVRASAAGEERGGILTAAEVSEAEERWLKEAQRRSFPAEIAHLERSTAKTDLVLQLSLFLDGKGLLRSQGRLSEANISAAANCPILIPSKTHLEVLLVRDAHNRVMHGGVPSTLCKLREKFWLVRGRQRVKAIIGKCVICKRLQGLPYAVKQVPALPEPRVKARRAFEWCGLDYCGPVKLKENAAVEKGYILVCTCAATRALHLELVKDLTTETFLHALRRFCARRGIPHLISDNAKTFTKAARILQASESRQVQDFCTTRKITWQFITERAPWQGGFWERLMKDIKLALRKTLLNASLTPDQLVTVLMEVEAVLNSRPMLYVDAEPNGEVLTPAHFLVLQRLTAEPTSSSTPELLLPLPTLLKRMRARLHAFWDCWERQYLTSLREHRLTPKHGIVREAEVGDIVLVKGEAGQPRLTWCTGVIESVHPGRDGAVRSGDG